MTAVNNVTSLRQRREAIVKQHAEAENRHYVEATNDAVFGETIITGTDDGEWAGIPVSW
jgi:hypothetical protein